MAHGFAYRKSYTDILDRVYQREATSSCLNSLARMARAGRNAEEIMIPKISVSCLGDYKRNVGYKTGSITFDYETKAFNYDRGIKLLADVMDVEEAGVLDCFVQAGAGGVAPRHRSQHLASATKRVTREGLSEKAPGENELLAH